MAGTSKVIIRRKATRKDGSSTGTVKTVNRTNINAPKITNVKKRIITRKAPVVNHIKGS